MDRRGQAAIEYVALIGIVLLFATPIVLRTQVAAADLQRTADVVEARNALDTIGEGARFVSAQGEPSTITFDVTLPRGIEATNVTGNYVHLRIDVGQGASDLYEFFDFNISGSIPAEQGRHTLVATAVGQRNVTINAK